MWEPFASTGSTERIIDAAQRAPSLFNAQPWSFRIVTPERIELRANFGDHDGVDRGHWDRWVRTDVAHHPNPLTREFAISCGAALFNRRLAIRVAGHDLSIWLFPDPGRDSTLLASVEIMIGRIKKPTVAEQELYEAIWLRHTNRWPYTLLPVPLPLLVEMEGAAAEEDVWLRLMHGHETRRWMRAVARSEQDLPASGVQPAVLSATRMAEFVEERDRMVPQENGEYGVPLANFGPRPDKGAPRTRRDFWLPGSSARFERRSGLGPLFGGPRVQLMSLSTNDDQPADWLRAGQGLERAVLTAARYSDSAPYGRSARYKAPPRYGLPAHQHFRPSHDTVARHGIAVSFLTEPLELEDIRSQSRRWPWRSHYPEVPQMVMRVGYPSRITPASPRMRVPEALDPDGASA